MIKIPKKNKPSVRFFIVAQILALFILGSIACTAPKRNRIHQKSNSGSQSEQTQNVASSAERGYIVGRVYVKIDGFQNVHREIIERSKIEIAYVKDYKIKILRTTTDSRGYFVLKNQPLDGYYFPYKIRIPNLNQPLPSVVPDPDPNKGVGGRLFTMFSSNRESFDPIIDCGETIIKLKKSGKLAVQRSLGKKRAILDFTTKNKYELRDGNYGYPGLRYFSKSGNGKLKNTAGRAYQNANAKARAESLVKAIPQKAKLDELVQRWTEVLRVYSNMEQIYGKLAFYYKVTRKQNEAIQTYKKLLSEKPDDLWLRVYLIRSYLDAGNVSGAVRTANRGKKSFVYFNTYQSLWGRYQYNEAEQMLRKAIQNYSDDTLFSQKYEKLTKKLAGLPVEKRSKILFFCFPTFLRLI